jgi:hypothetical protein
VGSAPFRRKRIEPFYPKPGNGLPPVGVERMLRVYFLQQRFNRSDAAVEEALHNSQAMRRFVGIVEGSEDRSRPAPTRRHRRGSGILCARGLPAAPVGRERPSGDSVRPPLAPRLAVQTERSRKAVPPENPLARGDPTTETPICGHPAISASARRPALERTTLHNRAIRGSNLLRHDFCNRARAPTFDKLTFDDPFRLVSLFQACSVAPNELGRYCGECIDVAPLRRRPLALNRLVAGSSPARRANRSEGLGDVRLTPCPFSTFVGYHPSRKSSRRRTRLANAYTQL